MKTRFFCIFTNVVLHRHFSFWQNNFICSNINHFQVPSYLVSVWNSLNNKVLSIYFVHFTKLKVVKSGVCVNFEMKEKKSATKHLFIRAQTFAFIQKVCFFFRLRFKYCRRNKIQRRVTFM